MAAEMFLSGHDGDDDGDSDGDCHTSQDPGKGCFVTLLPKLGVCRLHAPT